MQISEKNYLLSKEACFYGTIIGLKKSLVNTMIAYIPTNRRYRQNVAVFGRLGTGVNVWMDNDIYMSAINSNSMIITSDNDDYYSRYKDFFIERNYVVKYITADILNGDNSWMFYSNGDNIFSRNIITSILGSGIDDNQFLEECYRSIEQERIEIGKTFMKNVESSYPALKENLCVYFIVNDGANSLINEAFVTNLLAQTALDNEHDRQITVINATQNPAINSYYTRLISISRSYDIRFRYLFQSHGQALTVLGKYYNEILGYMETSIYYGDDVMEKVEMLKNYFAFKKGTIKIPRVKKDEVLVHQFLGEPFILKRAKPVFSFDSQIGGVIK